MDLSEAQKIGRQCPNPSCGSFDIKNPRKLYMWGGVITAILSLPWMVIFIGIPVFLAAVVVFFIGAATHKDKRICKQCKLSFSVKDGVVGIYGE